MFPFKNTKLSPLFLERFYLLTSFMSREKDITLPFKHSGASDLKAQLTRKNVDELLRRRRMQIIHLCEQAVAGFWSCCGDVWYPAVVFWRHASVLSYAADGAFLMPYGSVRSVCPLRPDGFVFECETAAHGLSEGRLQ